MDPEHARFTAILGALQRIVREPDAPRQIAADRGAFLAGAGLAPEDAASLGHADERRLLLYRKLVRGNLERAVSAEIPRTAARLEGAFAGWVGRFLEEEAPRSHYFRDVAFEFVAWAAPHWADDIAVPGYLADLARHELSLFEVATAEDARGPTGLELELDRAARFHASARLFRYAHAIHRLAADEAARDAPAREPTALLAYRDAEHDVRYLELTPLAAAILDRLLAGEPLRAAVVASAAALAHPLDGAVLTGTAALLDDLVIRGALLGGEPG